MALLARLVAVFALVLLTLTGCGDDKSDSKSGEGTSTTKTQGGAKIEIKNFQFEPLSLKVKVGDKITVVNRDANEHTVTASDKSFDTGPLKEDQEATFTVTTAGTYNYICSIHPYMAATLIVEA